MARLFSLIGIIVIVAVAWKVGGNVPSYPSTSPLSVQGSVKGVMSDTVAPVSHWISKPAKAGQGTALMGEASDLGSGLSEVVVQIQRQDGLVWDGSIWQESPGATLTTKLTGTVFTFTIPVAFKTNEGYIIRSQAIDRAGNAQTNWAELTVTGYDTADQINFR